MRQKATFGAGCFWHVEEAFRKVGGVTSTKVGYMGGNRKHPSYNDVSSGRTGHAEVCQVEFDPTIITYEGLLEQFWKIHDPTQEDRQGPDIGTQYRSVIFFHDDDQKEAAARSKGIIQKIMNNPVMTAIVPARTFYQAEDYHQKYFQNGKNFC